ncbi:winged helix-turn-helix transcriptional regulator [Liquorilactobacillus mali]|uniref:HxlR family transcriptional regulator n=1 Tax=Liquorilactobacillus mali KCTC 3596 = DSM 20444 TaxID=1046596 RepID=J1F0U4_9LACO|nr:helix-turn-helix domain-containing protein [Liquorilactobacillus mali]EJE97721.1 HxlR family transcriptional regulator [Liquorilactobacillus mali KCTC 3596 = DSM 20444]KRN05060.1 HxlR family transcriptional regulator [Liquorilactobacillus mali KCTC 3596 = DSM 20444]MDC7952789.1 helix-turn-helix transcriptional regulator [Liquorilactobacillus mali]QFQ75426.1 helix-turn-helix transcriptional regulator [Liquorilactobacillus mali]
MTDLARKAVMKKLINGDYNCQKEFTLSMFSGKWKINIIYHLGHEGTYYFYQLQKLLPHASHKELSEKLKELVEDGLINRRPEAGPRIKVAYSLTNLGKSLLPIIDEMYVWGGKRLQELRMQNINFSLGEVKK